MCPPFNSNIQDIDGSIHVSVPMFVVSLSNTISVTLRADSAAGLRCRLSKTAFLRNCEIPLPANPAIID
jgi:hypothetical protein